MNMLEPAFKIDATEHDVLEFYLPLKFPEASSTEAKFLLNEALEKAMRGYFAGGKIIRNGRVPFSGMSEGEDPRYYEPYRNWEDFSQQWAFGALEPSGWQCPWIVIGRNALKIRVHNLKPEPTLSFAYDDTSYHFDMNYGEGLLTVTRNRLSLLDVLGFGGHIHLHRVNAEATHGSH